MNNSIFWQDVTKTYQALPLKMKVVWLLAPPMCALVVIAYTMNLAERITFSQIDAAS